MAEHALEEKVGRGGQAHRGAGVTRARLLDGVHRQGTYDVDRPAIEVAPLKVSHEFAAQLLDLLITRWRPGTPGVRSGSPPTPDLNGSLPSP
ncbi:hypothetical protein GCM10009677_46680 [Sphaerisporangium rubeum]